LFEWVIESRILFSATKKQIQWQKKNLDVTNSKTPTLQKANPMAKEKLGRDKFQNPNASNAKFVADGKVRSPPARREVKVTDLR